MLPPPRITSTRFTLRPWSPSDTPALQATLTSSDSHLRAWTPWVIDGRTPGLSLEQRLARHAEDFAAGKEWVYGIFAPENSEVLGGCGLYPRVGAGAIEIGYWLAVTQTGRGLATEATAVLTRVAFTDPSIERVEIRCDPANVASNEIPRRLGYRVDETAAAGANGLTVWRLDRADLAGNSLLPDVALGQTGG